MSRISVLAMFFTGEVQRSISSMAPGTLSASATSCSH